MDNGQIIKKIKKINVESNELHTNMMKSTLKCYQKKNVFFCTLIDFFILGFGFFFVADQSLNDELFFLNPY